MILGGLFSPRRLDARLRGGIAGPLALDDRERRGSVLVLYPVQRHAVRPAGGGERPRGELPGFSSTWADSAGYAGSCVLLLWRNLGLKEIAWLGVFEGAIYAVHPGSGRRDPVVDYFNARARNAAVNPSPSPVVIPDYP